MYIVFIVCSSHTPLIICTHSIYSYYSERQLLENGKKPPNRKDFTWSEDDPAAFPARYGVRCLRGAEIFEVRDEDNVILNDLSK